MLKMCRDAPMARPPRMVEYGFCNIARNGKNYLLTDAITKL